jgi:hypothetical protein
MIAKTKRAGHRDMGGLRGSHNNLRPALDCADRRSPKVVFIVIAVGAGRGLLGAASLGALAACLVVVICKSCVDLSGSREANLVAFHVRHETAVDVVVVAFVPTLATVSLGQFDAVIFDPIDGADMDAVRANYFHMLFDAAHSGHSWCPVDGNV